MRKRPNILVILTDQQRPDSLGCYGNVFTHTPHMDALAAAGTRFETAFTVFPLCTPSRAALWTGLYPSATGVVDVVSPDIADAFAFGPHRLDLFTALKRAGYFQAYFGKWHLGSHVPDGMDVWKAFNSGGGQWVDGYQAYEGGTYIPDQQTDAMVDLIDGLDADGPPFFLVQSYYPPHEPYTAPDRYMDLYRGKGVFRPGYYAAVSALDDCVGRIVAALKARGVYDDTVIILTSDHGEHFNYRALNNKSTGHDESLQIPLIVSHPAGLTAGRSISGFVGIQDIAPTVLEIADQPVPAHLHGQSLLSVLDGEAVPGRESFYAQNVQDFRTMRDWERVFEAGSSYAPNTRDHFSAAREWDRQRALRTAGHKLILSEQGDHLMYDLTRDPEEEIDIFGAPKQDFHNQTVHLDDQTATMRRLVGQLRAEAEAIGDGFGMALADRVLRALAAF